MSRRSAVSRADLLESLRLTGAHGGETAAACGFVAVEKREPRVLPPQGTEPASPPDEKRAVPEPEPEPEKVPVFPEALPKLTFLMPVLAETLELERERRAVDLPPGISDERLALPRGVAGLPLTPLVRWARLAPFLKRILGRSVPGAAIDQRRLAREAGRGLPLTVLPRLSRRVWAGQALVLRDDTMEMAPFRRDVTLLLRRLRRERGRAGLREVPVRSAPRAAMLAGLPADAPVLALSCMGQYAGAVQQMAAWCGLAQRLAWRGNPLHALAPVPRRCQQAAVVRAWPVVVWDHGVRLPRETARRGALPPQDRSVATERLLDLLSPATFVEAPLLRAVRRRVRGADAAAEWHAWHHPLHWSAPDSFGFLGAENLEEASAVHAARLARRRALPVGETDPVDALIARQHAAHSVVIAAEARLRVLLCGPADAGQLAGVQTLLDEVLQRLRVLATEPGGSAGRRSGLAAWFLRMVDRLPPAMRGAPAVADAIARGLAAAHVFLETDQTIIPAGVDHAAFTAETRAAAGRMPEAQTYRLDLLGDQWTAEWCLSPAEVPAGENASPLSLLQISSQSVIVAAEGQDILNHVGSTGDPIPLPALVAPAPVVVDCGRERLHLAPRERPWWACRMQYDRGGLAAFVDLNGLRLPLRWIPGNAAGQSSGGRSPLSEGPGVRTGAWVAEQHLPWGRLIADEFGPVVTFHIDYAVFTLRWIPPGTFLMGSPEEETGRQTNEGPRHLVRISQGFWMGDSPVTQEQWRAVIQSAPQRCPDVWRALGKGRQPSASPSHFEGHGDLPVEQVSWHDSQIFCQLLQALIPGGPDFRLPTEAQWEYACRAGTTSAFYDGSACTLPEGKDPALDALGWFTENSSRESQPVKQKQANAWGLHDMHGNVWEWCRDAWDAQAYQKRRGITVDPDLPGNNSAGRVVRGGSWYNQARICRDAFRSRNDPGSRWSSLGLRLSAGQEPVAAEPPGAERPARRAEGRSPEAAAERKKIISRNRANR